MKTFLILASIITLTTIVGFVPLSMGQMVPHQFYSEDLVLLNEIRTDAPERAFNQARHQGMQLQAELSGLSSLSEQIIPPYDNPFAKIPDPFAKSIESLDLYIKQHYTSDEIEEMYYQLLVTFYSEDEDAVNGIPDYAIPVPLTLYTESGTFTKYVRDTTDPTVYNAQVVVKLDDIPRLDNDESILRIYQDEMLYHASDVSVSSSVEEQVKLEPETPLQQLKNNLEPYEVSCKDNYVLLINESVTRSICVTIDSSDTLQERGWIYLEFSHDDTTKLSDTDNITNTPDHIDATNLIDANNQFALNFYTKVSQESDENVFFSPWSIMTAFAIVNEGAKENTAEQMQNVFGFSSNDTQRQNEFKSVNDELNQKDSNYSLQVANALWLADFFEPLKEYVDVAKNYYDSEVSAVNFGGNEGVDTINKWVGEKTHDKIKTILAPGSTDESTRLVITNAIYFKGTWVTQFDEGNTKDQNFMIDSDVVTKVPMMNLYQTQQVYGETDEIKILELPYEGDKLSMLFLLPKEIDGMDNLENSLTVENLKQWRESLSIHDVSIVSIPKFELETYYDLIPSLQKLGISDAFANKANFSGITTSEQLFIEFALHKAYVDVNEEGTEAAAVTAVGIAESYSVNRSPILSFVADHPFVFVIQNNETGHILFMGKMTDPSK